MENKNKVALILFMTILGFVLILITMNIMNFEDKIGDADVFNCEDNINYNNKLRTNSMGCVVLSFRIPIIILGLIIVAIIHICKLKIKEPNKDWERENGK